MESEAKPRIRFGQRGVDAVYACPGLAVGDDGRQAVMHPQAALRKTLAASGVLNRRDVREVLGAVQVCLGLGVATKNVYHNNLLSPGMSSPLQRRPFFGMFVLPKPLDEYEGRGVVLSIVINRNLNKWGPSLPLGALNKPQRAENQNCSSPPICLTLLTQRMGANRAPGE